jgi:hypothetical protein
MFALKHDAAEPGCLLAVERGVGSGDDRTFGFPDFFVEVLDDVLGSGRGLVLI